MRMFYATSVSCRDSGKKSGHDIAAVCSVLKAVCRLDVFSFSHTLILKTRKWHFLGLDTRWPTTPPECADAVQQGDREFFC